MRGFGMQKKKKKKTKSWSRKGLKRKKFYNTDYKTTPETTYSSQYLNFLSVQKCSLRHQIIFILLFDHWPVKSAKSFLLFTEYLK